MARVYGERFDTYSWEQVGEDFTYPWGIFWSALNWRNRPRGRAGYKTRRLSAFDRKMLNRITSNRKPEPAHPDQLRLF